MKHLTGRILKQSRRSCNSFQEKSWHFPRKTPTFFIFLHIGYSIVALVKENAFEVAGKHSRHRRRRRFYLHYRIFDAII